MCVCLFTAPSVRKHFCISVNLARHDVWHKDQHHVLQVESEDVVFALETIVENFGGEMAPFAVGLCQHLTQAFWRLQVRLAALKAMSATAPHSLLSHHYSMEVCLTFADAALCCD